MTNQLLTYLNNNIKALLNVGDKRAALFARIGLKRWSKKTGQVVSAWIKTL